MSSQAMLSPSWIAAQTGTGDVQRPDLALLRTHIERCAQDNGRWFKLRCAIESVHQFFAVRFVTTLTVLLLVIGSLSMAV